MALLIALIKRNLVFESSVPRLLAWRDNCRFRRVPGPHWGPSRWLLTPVATGRRTTVYVAGRATAVAIDTADPQGNIVYVGGAQGGIWKSTNAANPDPSTVLWTPISDSQATLAIGAIAHEIGHSRGHGRGE